MVKIVAGKKKKKTQGEIPQDRKQKKKSVKKLNAGGGKLISGFIIRSMRLRDFDNLRNARQSFVSNIITKNQE